MDISCHFCTPKFGPIAETKTNLSLYTLYAAVPVESKALMVGAAYRCHTRRGAIRIDIDTIVNLQTCAAEAPSTSDFRHNMATICPMVILLIYIRQVFWRKVSVTPQGSGSCKHH